MLKQVLFIFISGIASLLFSGYAQTDSDDSIHGFHGVKNVSRSESVQTVSIGDESSQLMSGSMPFNMGWPYSVVQSIYLQSEIGIEKGLITRLTYPINTVNPPLDKLQIYLANTDKENLFDDGFWIPEDQFTLVYEGLPNFPMGIEDVVIDLQTPFVYKGQNLCIMTKPVSNNYLNNIRGYITTVTPHRTRVYSDYFTEFDGSQQGFSYNSIPNVRILVNTADAGSLSGTITSADITVEGVAVELSANNLSTSTSADGAYSFDYVPEGSYIISASKHGFFDVSETVEVTGGNQLVKDIKMTERAKHIATIKVTDAEGIPVESATVKVDGYENYSVTTDENGTCSVTAYDAEGYLLVVSKTKWQTYTDTFDLTDNAQISVVLKDVEYVPFNVFATDNQTEIKLSWGNPADVFPKTYILDNGSYEGGWSMTDTEANLGNLYITTDDGFISSVDIYGVANWADTGREVLVNIFDAEGRLLGQSEKFVIPYEDGWVNVPLPDVSFSGSFYAMVYWPAAEGASNYIGYDQDSEYANEGAWFYDGTTMVPFCDMFPEDQKPNAGVFMIRVNAMSKENKSVSYGYPKNIVKDLPVVKTSSIFSSTKATGNAGQPEKTLAKQVERPWPFFNVYRLNEADKSNETKWETLTSYAISDTEFTDNTWLALENGNYLYAVKAVYPENKMSEAAFSNVVTKETFEPSGSSMSFTWGVTDGEYKFIGLRVALGKAFIVDWGDESSLSVYSGTEQWQEISHTYANAGSYTVTVTGATEKSVFTGFDCWNAAVTNIDFNNMTSLTNVGCATNKLVSLDLSMLTGLMELYCFQNQLTELNLRGLTELKDLQCFENQLKAIDVTDFTNLNNLVCNNNLLSQLKVSGCNALSEIKCGNNKIEKLDVSHLSGLTLLWCNDNEINELLVNGCSSLRQLNCYKNNLSKLDASSLLSLSQIWAYENVMTDLNIVGCTSLKDLDCSDNCLVQLNAGGLVALEKISCYDNQLESLNVEGDISLTDLRCINNKLTSLNVSGLTALSILHCNNNLLTSLDISANTNLNSLDCSDNCLTSLNMEGVTNLWDFSCFNNSLLLSDLYRATKPLNSSCVKKLGNQTLPLQTESVGIAIDLSSQSVFDANATIFKIEKDGSVAVAGVDYSLTEGIITFLIDGEYKVTMVNDAIEAYEGFEAKVIAEYSLVKSGISEIDLQDLAFSFDSTKGIAYVESRTLPLNSLRAFDVAGHVVAFTKVTDTKAVLEITNALAGVYFIQIETENGVLIKKVIKK